jgi:hypothetical protein
MTCEDAWIVGIGIAAVVVALVTTPADAAPAVQTGDVLYAMVKIAQPLKIDERVYEDHEIHGSLYADRESCEVRAKHELQQNAVEAVAGTAKFRIFVGCLPIPAPGKTPAASPAPAAPYL